MFVLVLFFYPEMSNPPPDLSPIRLAGPKDYFVQIDSDDQAFHIIVAALDSFAAAAGEYNRLTKGRPLMRVTMRHRAHVYRHYVPDRLKRPDDRRD